MFKQFKNSFLSITVFAVASMFSFTGMQNGKITPSDSPTIEKVLTSGLTVTVITATSVSLSWDSWPGAGDYTVTVKNLTTNQVEKIFTTSSTSANVNSLSTGDTYRFSVGKNGYIITEEVVM